MRNRVFFGSYSLEHWLNLLRTQDIILPKYQRHFVWDKERMSKLADAIINDLFVPPITIGAFNNSGKLENLIIDGQQRLTSILLAHLGIFPDKEHYRQSGERVLAQEDAGLEDMDSEEEENAVLKWNVNELLGEDNSINAIKERAKKNGHYVFFEPMISSEILKDRFLGFNFLVPTSKNPKQMQKYFSSVFRSVNYSGVNLLPQESRKALYYLDSDFENFFTPDFCDRITVNSKKTKGDVILDFTRFLALLSIYHHTKMYTKVGRGYGRRIEVFYELFIQWVVSDENQDIFGEFEEIFPGKDYHSDLSSLQTTINSLELNRRYDSIIDLDVFFMGLIYLIMFDKKALNIERKTELIDELKKAVDKFKGDPKHKRSPASVKYLRERMEKSIEIYYHYVQE